MDKGEAYHKRMVETPIPKLIALLGIPTTISMLVTNIYNLADTYFVGTLGESAQGATGILFTLQCVIQAVAFMLGHGSGTYVSKCLADRDYKTANKYVSSSFFLGALLGILLLVFGLLFIEPFMMLLGSTNTILPYAKEYGMWVMISAPFMVMAFILNNNLRYEGKAFYAMFGLVSGSLLNILGDYIFITVMGLGVYGAGMSTAISQIISFVMLLIFYIIFAQGKLKISAIAREVRIYTDILRNGFPSFIRQGLAAVSNGVLNNMCNPFGDDAIAAMSVVGRYSSFIMCIGLGIGQGMQPVTAYNYRIKRNDRVKKAVWFTLGLSIISMLIVSIIGLVIPDKIMYVFQKRQEVIDIGIFALQIAGLSAIFLPISLVANMLFQSIRKSEIASFISLLRSGLVFIPVLLIFRYSIGLTGIKMAQPISDVIAGLISLPFIIVFLRKIDQVNKVEEASM